MKNTNKAFRLPIDFTKDEKLTEPEIALENKELDDSIRSQIDSAQPSSSNGELVSDALSTNDQSIKQVAIDAPATNDLKPTQTLSTEAIASQPNSLIVNPASTTVTSIPTDLLDSTSPDFLAEKNTLLESNIKNIVTSDSSDTAANEVSELKDHLSNLISEETFEQQEEEDLKLPVSDLPVDAPNATIEKSVLSPVVLSETTNVVGTIPADEAPEPSEDGATGTVIEPALAEPLTVNDLDAVPVAESLHSAAVPSAKPKVETTVEDSNVNVADAHAEVSAVEPESVGGSTETNQKPAEILESLTLNVNNSDETANFESSAAQPDTVESSIAETAGDVSTNTEPQPAATEIDVSAPVTADQTESEHTAAESDTTDSAVVEPLALEAVAVDQEISVPVTENAIVEPTVEPAESERTTSEDATEPTIIKPDATEQTDTEPAIAEHADNKGATTEPVVAEPVTVESTVAESSVEPAVAEKATVESTAAEPVAVQVGAAESATEEAITIKAVVAGPAAEEPVEVDAAVAEPVAAEPVTVKAIVAKHAAEETVAEEAAVAEPAAAETVAVEVVAAETVAAEAAVVETAIEEHVAIDAAVAKPVAVKAVTAETAAAEPRY